MRFFRSFPVVGRASLVRHWSTAAVVLTLATGIGALTAIYAVLDAVLFGPVPGVTTPATLISIGFETPNRSATAYGNRAALPALRDAGAGAGLDLLADYFPSPVAVGSPGLVGATLRQAAFVTSEYFAVLGVRPRLGRLLTDSEADSDSDAAVISESLWRSLFGEASNIVGQSFEVNGHAFTVIGVTDRFRGWGHTRSGQTDLWLPAGAERKLTGQVESTFWGLVGRVGTGTDLTRVESRLQSAYADAALQFAPRYGSFVPFVTAGLYPLNASSATVLHLYSMCMIAGLLVLVLACSDGAMLLLARGAGREREIAVRLALGASRWTIARRALVEATGLAVAAGVLGLLFALLFTQLLRGYRLVAYFPSVDDIAIDWRVLGFCLIATLLTALLFGSGPATIASRTPVRTILDRTSVRSGATHRLRNGLLISQVAMALILLAGAGVLRQSLANLLATSPGLDASQVLALQLKPNDFGYTSADSRRVLGQLLSALRDAGFRTALSYPDPLAGSSTAVAIGTDATSPAARRIISENSVSPDFFAVTGIRMLGGRTFTDQEYRDSSPSDPMPVILSQSLAKALFDDEAVIGRTFSIERSAGLGSSAQAARVVGVVGDIRAATIREVPREALYHTRQSPWRYGAILIRVDGAITDMTSRVRSISQAAVPAVPIDSLRLLQDEVAEDLAEDFTLARVGTLLAIVAGVLAAAGVAGMVVQVISEEARNLAVRSALGASSARLLRDFLGGLLIRFGIGAACGLVTYAIASRWLGARLFGISALDPIVLIGSVFAVGILVSAVTIVTARGAASPDPWRILQRE